MEKLSNVQQVEIGFHEHRRRASDRRCVTYGCPICRPDNHPDQLQLSIDDFTKLIARSAPEPIDFGLPPTPRDVLIDCLASIGVDDPAKVARALLQEFGSIPDLLGGSWRRLCRAVGRQIAVPIRASRSLMQSALEKPIMARPLISSRKDLHQYLRYRLGHAPRECVLAFFLDSSLRLIGIERVSSGSITEAKVDLAKIILRGFELGAAAFLLVHNHPSGDPRPSQADIRFTARAQYISKELNMPLVDHLIVAGGEVRSVGNW